MRSLLACTLLCLALLTARGQAQTAPQLDYTPPANAYAAAAGQGADYSFNGFNASIEIYPFRPFTGNIVQQFQTTLLREWIDPLHQEENSGFPPMFSEVTVPGADLAIDVAFAENIVGLPKPHNRMLIISGNYAALVDASAGTAQSWVAAGPSLDAVGNSLHVEKVALPPPLSAAAGAAVAGLYKGFKSKYVATNININGYASTVTALHFYLFSPDGRVYRAYDQLPLPAGGAARFDFAAAARADPQNAGSYTVDGNKLIITMGDSPLKPIVTQLPQGGTVTIDGVTYQRQ